MALGIILLSVQQGDARATAPAEPAERPNVLVVITDDQPVRNSGMWLLDSVSGLDSVTFENAFTNNPVCCPSRATMLSGLYDHHTGVTSNQNGDRFDDSASVATWFNDAGYRTGLYGKYLNGYPFESTSAPPGWNDWRAFVGRPDYLGYELAENDKVVSYGSEPADYSTTVLGDKLISMIEEANEPFFAVFSPYASHGPLVSSPEHTGVHAGKRVRKPRNFNRLMTDPPSWIADRPRLRWSQVASYIRATWETLEAVDDVVEAALGVLEEQGELDNTIIAYISDNGFSLGSHRIPRKFCAHEECIRVPFLISAPGVPPRNEDALVSNVDLAPTLADLAGVAHPAVDGRSLGPLMRADVTTLHRPILLHTRRSRSKPSFASPTYSGIRTKRWKLIDYRNGESELYALPRDPHELTNLAAKASYQQRIRKLRKKLAKLQR